MKIAAIISEYNPFHNGHKFHIEETKRQTGADAVILIMSGNFVQRGEVAIYDKKLRARAATICGADLCLELPTIYSSASAEFFSKGAVKILNSLGTIDFLSFGAETANPSLLMTTAQLLANEPAEYSALLAERLNMGISYPSARAKAVGKILGESFEELLSTPNNILAIEYCKALISTGSKITPYPILRKGAAHDSHNPDGDIASATFIRNLILNGGDPSPFIPNSAEEIFNGAGVHSLKALEKAILCELVKMPAHQLRAIADVSEGLENRIKAAAVESKTLDELLEKIKTKRYTLSRIRRIILSAFLGITSDIRDAEPSYIKILDHNQVGQKLISDAKSVATLPIVRNTSQINHLKTPTLKEMWERERIFDRIYDLSLL